MNKFNFEEINDKIKAIELYTYDETDMDDARVSIFGTNIYSLPYGGTFTRGDYLTSDL